ncbi:MAG: PLDc N-terminal domain-containing protein [Propionibacteriaceae bacterium]
MEIAVNADFLSLPTGLQIGIIALSVVELVLLLLAVIVNLKTTESRLTLPRVAWLAISILIGIVGPIAFLAAGRRKEQPPVTTAGASKTTAATAIDELYK